MQPKYILVNVSEDGKLITPGMICGWSSAVIVDGEERRHSLETIADELLASHRHPGSQASAIPRGLSTYVAPEQLVGMYFGIACSSPATDIYRLALSLQTGLTSEGPEGGLLGVITSPPCEPLSEGSKFRQIVMEALLQYSSGRHPGQEMDQRFRAILAEVCASREAPPLEGVHVALRPWFARCLQREIHLRFQSVSDAQMALDGAWAAYEACLLAERDAKEESCDERRTSSINQKLVLQRWVHDTDTMQTT